MEPYRPGQRRAWGTQGRRSEASIVPAQSSGHPCRGRWEGRHRRPADRRAWPRPRATP